MLTTEELTSLQSKKKELNAKIEKKEEEKETLYKQNATKVDIRTKKMSQCSRLMTLAWIALIVGIVGLLFFKGIAMIATPIVGVVAFVILLIMRNAPKKIVEELSRELSEYDSAVAAIDRDIADYSSKRSEIDYALDKDATEKKYAEYAENHICVYAGTSTSASLTNGKPQETANHYQALNTVTVFIDGVEYGNTSQPFAAFEVTPGNHVVKITGYYRFGGKSGVDRYVESVAQQVKTTNKSAFIFYHWNFYNTDKGLRDALYLKIYDNPFDFLKDTHQI